MPVIIKSNNFSTVFGYSGNTYTSNVGDISLLSLVVSSRIRITTIDNPFTVDPILGILSSPAKSWLDEGFRVGDAVIIIRYDSTGTVMGSLISLIDSVNDTQLNLSLWLYPIFYDISANEIMEVRSIIPAGAGFSFKQREDLTINFNHCLNNEIGNPASLIDSELSRLVFPNLSTLSVGSTRNASFVGNQSGQFLISASITYDGLDTDAFDQYTITLAFVNSGLYDFDSFTAGNCLKAFVNGLWSSNVGETSNRASFTFDEQANTGFFEEANNNSVPTGGFVVSPISEINYNATNNVTFTANLNGFTGNLGIGGAYISTDDSYFKNRIDNQKNITYLQETFPLTTGATYVSHNGVGTSSSANWSILINNIITSGGNIEVDLDFIPNSDFVDFIEGRDEDDRLFYLWIKIGNTNHLVYSNQLTKELPVGGPLIMNSDYGFLDHGQNINNIIGNKVGFSADTEDDVAYYGTFNLDLNKTTYNGINLRIEAFNVVTSDKFTLQQTNFSFGGVTFQTSTGKYLLNETSSINSVLQTTSEKRDAKITLTGNTTATQYEVAVYYPFLLNWQYWINLLGVNSDFAPNENQNWEQYDNPTNWIIRLTVELDDGGLAFVHSNQIVDNPYDNEPIVASSIELSKQSDGTVVSIIPTGDLLFIESTHILTGLTWDVPKIWGMITVEPTESSPRFYSSSIVPFDNSALNPLTPISGLLCQITNPTPNTIKLKCKFNPNKIDLSKGVKITAKIKQGLDNIVVLGKATTNDDDKDTTSDELKILA